MDGTVCGAVRQPRPQHGRKSDDSLSETGATTECECVRRERSTWSLCREKSGATCTTHEYTGRRKSYKE